MWRKNPHPQYLWAILRTPVVSSKYAPTIWKPICYWHLILLGGFRRVHCSSRLATNQNESLLKWKMCSNMYLLHIRCREQDGETFREQTALVGTLPMLPTFPLWRTRPESPLYTPVLSSLMASSTSGAASANPSALAQTVKSWITRVSWLKKIHHCWVKD